MSSLAEALVISDRITKLLDKIVCKNLPNTGDNTTLTWNLEPGAEDLSDFLCSYMLVLRRASPRLYR